MQRSKRRRLIGVALLTVLFIFVFKRLTADPASPAMLPKLERIVTVMQENRLLSYRNQDWCEGISGEAGSYSTVKTSERCERDIGKSKPFDSQSRERFDNVRDTAKKLGRGVDNVWLLYEREGDLRYAEIILSCFWCRESYVFSQDGEGLPPRTEITPVGRGWYYVVDPDVL